jgi:hypothetical protein
MLMGLQNLQGYNPTHISSYDDFTTKLNGAGQGYHFIDIYEEGLSSPLLNLLNARYIIVPAHPSQEDPASIKRFKDFESTHPPVYEDDQTKVFENSQALPRAWIVHQARQVQSGEEALELLSSAEVDPKETALLEEQPSQQLSQSEDASGEQAQVQEYQANEIKLKTTARSPGLLMLSEVYYPTWKAYVDGEPAEMHVADRLLRSVELPAGEHTVELRNEPRRLWEGVGISLVAYGVLVGLAVAVAARYLLWKGKGDKEQTSTLGGS